MPTNSKNMEKEFIEKIIKEFEKGHKGEQLMEVAEASAEMSIALTTATNKARQEGRDEVINELQEVPRLIITHKDGTESKALLEHSLRTHGLARTEK